MYSLLSLNQYNIKVLDHAIHVKMTKILNVKWTFPAMQVMLLQAGSYTLFTRYSHNGVILYFIACLVKPHRQAECLSNMLVYDMYVS